MDDFDEHGLPIWGAPERNKRPILEQLERFLSPPSALLLEVGSATGQHAAYFCERLPHVLVQPTDHDPEHLETLARRVELGLWPNLLPPLRLDAGSADWPDVAPSAIFCANVIHIAPLAVAHGLFTGASRLLAPGALLLTYGPYKIAGAHTSESNERFDESLKSRNPEWGVRDLDELAAFAHGVDLELEEKVALPANNFFVVWRRR